MRTRSIIAHHIILTLYGHRGANDPRGSGSNDFIDRKFESLGPIHHGRKADHLQPSRDELRAYHQQHSELLNFPVFWIDEAKREAMAEAFGDVVCERNYKCYACAILSNHAHFVIRIHRDRDDAIMRTLMNESRLRLRLSEDFKEISQHHPVWSSRPYNVYMYTPGDVHTRIRYIKANPIGERLAA